MWYDTLSALNVMVRSFKSRKCKLMGLSHKSKDSFTFCTKIPATETVPAIGREPKSREGFVKQTKMRMCTKYTQKYM
jgi:hypothetical protein